MSFNMSPDKLKKCRKDHIQNKDIAVITSAAIIRIEHLAAFVSKARTRGAEAVRVNLIRFDLKADTPAVDSEIRTSNGVLSQVSFAFEPVRIDDPKNWLVTSVADAGSILCVCPPGENDNDTGLVPPKGDENDGVS